MSDAATLPAAADHGHGHATVGTYVKITVILGVITAIEIGAIYLNWPDWIRYTLLGILSVAKFAMVVAFFMHLFYDNRVLTFLFLAGLVMATMTLLALKALSYVPSLQPPPPPKKVALQPPDVNRGKEVFASVGCTACHTLSSVPGATAKIGPVLDGLAQRAGSRQAGLSDVQYVVHSIENPQEYVVAGFDKAAPMPQLRDHMSDQQFMDLVAFLLSQGGNPAEAAKKAEGVR